MQGQSQNRAAAADTGQSQTRQIGSGSSGAGAPSFSASSPPAMELGTGLEPTDTRTRILLAARNIFAERGIMAATLREITDAAGANIASVNYHFRSKDELIRVVLEQSFLPVIRARTVALDRCLAEAGHGGPTPEALIRALVEPMVVLSRDPAGGRPLIRLLLQLRALPRADTNAIVAAQFDPVHLRFIEAFAKALPALSRDEIVWRFDFVRGAMMQILTDLDPALHRLETLTETPLTDRDDEVLRHLVQFTTAGMRAPAG